MLTDGAVECTAEVGLRLVLVAVLVVVVAASDMVLVPALMVVVSPTGLGVVWRVVVVSVVIEVAVAVVAGNVSVAFEAALLVTLVNVASAVEEAIGDLSLTVPPCGEAGDCSGLSVGAEVRLLVVINGSFANVDVDV